ncbi:HD-GYP domain-containing protein [Rhizobium sp. SG2393]|uniref:HD-GYP domain-containing protein n=1 Tax=Rhizobium sp. SG2393 TaxID=3276279 RepID=UPI00366E3E0E
MCPEAEFAKRRFLLETELDYRAIVASSADLVLVNAARSTVSIDSTAGRSAKAADPVVAARTRTAIANNIKVLGDSLDVIRQGDEFDFDSLQPAAASLVDSVTEAPAVLLQMTRLKSKDQGTFVHSIAVAGLMARLGAATGMDADAIQLLATAGLLHDLGKLFIPDAILKKQGELTDAERKVIRTHPQIGYDILKRYPGVPQMVLDICRLHHEALDGSGYPLGLSGDEISQIVRLSTVCDVFDALTTVRPYKRAWTREQAIHWMFDRGHLFDRKLVLSLGRLLDAME